MVQIQFVRVAQAHFPVMELEDGIRMCVWSMQIARFRAAMALSRPLCTE